MKKVEIYKGVPLTNGRTKEIVDTVIEKRNDMSAIELAKLLGYKGYQPIAAISRYLNKEFDKVTTISNKKIKKTVKTTKNTFTNYGGGGKKEARNLIAKYILKTNIRDSNIITLPAEKWFMERNILKQKEGYKFTAVERDNVTFIRMLQTLNSDNTLLKSVEGIANKSVSEVVETAKENTYSSAILDYCGYIDTFYNEIDDILNRNLIRNGGYIAITLAENYRSINNSLHKNSLSNDYIRRCSNSEKVSGYQVTKELVNYLVFKNKNYKVVERFKYTDTTARMLLFIIQRID